MPPPHSNVDVKRVRRTFEPTDKAWNDQLLELPWEELEKPLSKPLTFSIKNVFFFSHATAVQAAAIPKFSGDESSVVVEAPTGCGKTLAFLIPVMERLVQQCDAHVAQHKRPFLTRNIVAAVLSPSRVLAEQTFVVARNLAARLPHNIQVALCDGSIETPEVVAEHLQRVSRGAGIVVISTPSDFHALLLELRNRQVIMSASSSASAAKPGNRNHGVFVSDELLADQDEETIRRYLKKKELQESKKAAADGNPTTSHQVASEDSGVARAVANAGHPFVIVLDEADVILKAEEMRNVVHQLLEDFIFPAHDIVSTTATSPSPPQQKGKRGQKRQREEQSTVSSKVDFGLFGATVGLSSRVREFCDAMLRRCSTTFSDVFLRNQVDFVSQLTNRFYICEAHDLLQSLVHIINLHPTKKHFVFFNSTAVLLFVKHLLVELSKGSRPVLFTKHIYAMYDEMKESTKFSEYNSFLQHSTRDALDLQRQQRADYSRAQEKNPHFQGGWKRDSKPLPGVGAVLLCTDLAAFGLDVRDVDYVYHFEPPTTVRSYVHRIGRVGRMGMRGCSILLLPCFAANSQESSSGNAMCPSRERKATSLRYNTITNTKATTSMVQSATVDEDCLDAAKTNYLTELQKYHKLELFHIPPLAPLTATIRAAVHGDSTIVKLAKRAAMTLCKNGSGGVTEEAEEEVDSPTPSKSPDAGSAASSRSWYDPPLAMAAVLLD